MKAIQRVKSVISKTMPSNSRFESVELMRGLAAITVCFYHLTNGFIEQGNLLREGFSKGYLGVQVFFVISGFVIPLSMYRSRYDIRNFFRFLGKRLIRIEVPYWVSIWLFLERNNIYEWLKGEIAPPIYWDNIVYHFFHLNDLIVRPPFVAQKMEPTLHNAWICDVYWSLAIEVQYYIFMALAFGFLMSKNQWIRWASMLLFAYSSLYFHDRFILWFSSYFLVGIITAQRAVDLIPKWEFRITLVLALIFIYHYRSFDHFAATLITVIGIYYVHPGKKWATFMGEISYSVYLLHIFVGWTFCLIVLSNPAFKDINRTLLVLMAIALSIGFSYLFYHFVEKRAIEWSKLIPYKKFKDKK